MLALLGEALLPDDEEARLGAGRGAAVRRERLRGGGRSGGGERAMIDTEII